ncbi:MAG: hypothetical protein ABSD74_01190 [Rhizomicrobium sp.]|jgi:hypothetical protein
MPTEGQRKIFHEIAGNAVENSHNAIKQVWVALFAGGTFSFIKSFDDLMHCAHVFFPYPDERVHCSWLLGGDNESIRLAICISLYVAYALTFYRFYVGNIRVFDLRYVEIVKFTKLLYESDRAAFERLFDHLDEGRRWDSIYLIFKTFVIISLTIEINTPFIFFSIYFLVLLLDVAWIRIAIHPRPLFKPLFFETIGLPAELGSATSGWPQESRVAYKELEMTFSSHAMTIWTRNNTIFSIIMLVLIPLPYLYRGSDLELYSLILLSLCVIMNSLIDLIMTWNFYNPKFSKGYRLFLNEGRPVGP